MPTKQQTLHHPLSGLNVPVTLIRDDGLSGPTYAGELCGTLGDAAVIVGNLGGTPFKPGDAVIVQARLRGEAIGFTATVLAAPELPVPHYLLSFPESWEGLELRRARRVPTLIPVRVAPLTHEQPGLERAEVINLSAGGCALYLQQRCPERARLRVWINLPGEPNHLVLELMVVNRREGLGAVVHGTRFEPAGERDPSIDVIAAWVADRSFDLRDTPYIHA